MEKSRVLSLNGRIEIFNKGSIQIKVGKTVASDLPEEVHI